MNEAFPAPLVHHAMVYDEHRGVTVLFGGQLADETESDQLWEWDGTTWTDKTSVSALRPSARRSLNLSYDYHRKVVVLFGGLFYNGVHSEYLRDTWEWDGVAWTEKTTLSSPPRSYEGAMAYDYHRKQTTLFAAAEMNDADVSFWHWDGAVWTQTLLDNKPTAAVNIAMTYDRDRQKTIVHGGCPNRTVEFCMSDNVSNQGIDQTWEWSGYHWENKTDPNLDSPGPRFEHTLAYHEGKALAYLFGGNNLNAASDIWSWDGNVWVDATPLDGDVPPQTREHAMVYDPITDLILIFGGQSSGAGTANNALWSWDGSEWQEISAHDASDISKPSPRLGHAMIYDITSGDILLFGGADPDGYCGSDDLVCADFWRLDTDTFEWEEVQYLESDAQPSGRVGHALVADESRHTVALLNGSDTYRAALYFAKTPVDELWEWDGFQWAKIESDDGPGATVDHAMVYDARRQSALLFGGRDFSDSEMNQTWHWSGNKKTVATLNLDHLGIKNVAQIKRLALSCVSNDSNSLVDVSLLSKGVWLNRAGGTAEASWETENRRTIDDSISKSSGQVISALTSFDTQNGIYDDFNWDYLEMRVTYNQGDQGGSLPELECGDGGCVGTFRRAM